MRLQTKFSALEADVKDDGVVEGYASKFGIVDQGGDIVVAGAFADSISTRKPKMLWQHDPSQPIGVWDSISEDSQGLAVKGRLNLGCDNGRNVHSNLKFGVIEGMSIGYRTRDAKKTKGGRELRRVDLWEVSFVTFPMQLEAVLSSVKDIEGENPAMLKRFVEELLREADFSADEAKAAAAAVARVRAEREVSAGQMDTTLVSDLSRIIRGLE